MTNPDEEIEQFYGDLDRLISTVPKSEKVVLMGDFNARVGTWMHSRSRQWHLIVRQRDMKDVRISEELGAGRITD